MSNTYKAIYSEAEQLRRFEAWLTQIRNAGWPHGLSAVGGGGGESRPTSLTTETDAAAGKSRDVKAHTVRSGRSYHSEARINTSRSSARPAANDSPGSTNHAG